MEKQLSLYKNIHELKVQKELLNRQLSQIIFDKPELTNQELESINLTKKKISEIDNKISSLKKEIDELYKNNNFECSYSVVTENGKTTESYKINGEEVSKIDYFKALKENSLSRRKLLENFSKGFGKNFLSYPFFKDRFPFLDKPEKKECDCHKHLPRPDKDNDDFFDAFFWDF